MSKSEKGVIDKMERVRLGMIGSKLAANIHLNNLSKLRGLKVDVVAPLTRAGASAGASPLAGVA